MAYDGGVTNMENCRIHDPESYVKGNAKENIPQVLRNLRQKRSFKIMSCIVAFQADMSSFKF